MNFFEYFLKIKHGVVYQVTVVPFFRGVFTWDRKISTWLPMLFF
jgi:hypothetical protein